MVVVNILDGLALTKFVVKPVLVIMFQKKILREKSAHVFCMKKKNETKKCKNGFRKDFQSAINY